MRSKMKAIAKKKAKVTDKVAKVNGSGSVRKKSITKITIRKVFGKNKKMLPQKKAIRVKGKPEFKKYPKNCNSEDASKKGEMQNNHLPLKRMALAFDPANVATVKAAGNNVENDARKVLSNLANHNRGLKKSSIKMTIRSKAGSGSRVGKKEEGNGICGRKADAKKIAGKGKSASVARTARVRAQNGTEAMRGMKRGKIPAKKIASKSPSKKQMKPLIRIVGPEKTNGVNGGGNAKGGKIKQKNGNDGKIKLESAAAATVKPIIEQENISSRLRSRMLVVNAAPKGTQMMMRKGPLRGMKMAKKKRAK